MGASAKRKELRRERFKDVQQIDHQTANEANLEGMSVEKTELSSEEPFAVVGTAETTSDKPKGEAKQADPSTIKKHRFICFIGDLPDPMLCLSRLTALGNLPFTATTEAITKHFATVKPNSIRHGTDRSSGKSRGFAFLEFDNYSWVTPLHPYSEPLTWCRRMQGCIRNFHHSSFSDGISASRRINVELT